MEKINDGGPAFPAVSEVVGHMPDGSLTVKDITSGGMTLRDYFAAKAMQGLYASDTEEWNSQGDEALRAKQCYEMADAMLKAREVKS